MSNDATHKRLANTADFKCLASLPPSPSLVVPNVVCFFITMTQVVFVL